MAASHQTDAFSEPQSSLATVVNAVDAFSFSEENLKDKLIFSHVLAPEVRTIVLDAGHGGKDRGCKGSHFETKEKDIALGITLKLGAYIESYFPEVNVLYTRKKDVFIPLTERAALANKAKADLFISIHCNYIRNRPDVLGSETYVMGLHTADHNLKVAMRENAAITMEEDFGKSYAGYDPDSPESHIMLAMYQNAYLERSILFAELVEQQIPLASDGAHSSRGVRQAGFLVLKETAMPSVLVESGYISHEKDETFLMSSEGQKDVAFGIFKAFSIYKNVIEDNDPGELTTVALKDDKPVVKEIAVKPAPKAKVNVKPTKAVVVKKAEPVIKTVKRSKSEDGLEYMIQLTAVPSKIDLSTSQFADIADQVVVKKSGGLYKYLLPAGDNHDSASEMLQHVQNNGFPKTFISVYKGDERVKILYK